MAIQHTVLLISYFSEYNLSLFLPVIFPVWFLFITTRGPLWTNYLRADVGLIITCLGAGHVLTPATQHVRPIHIWREWVVALAYSHTEIPKYVFTSATAHRYTYTDRNNFVYMCIQRYIKCVLIYVISCIHTLIHIRRKRVVARTCSHTEIHKYVLAPVIPHIYTYADRNEGQLA